MNTSTFDAFCGEDDSVAEIRQRLVDFYTDKFPDRVGKVDSIMQKFAGKEDQIVKMIEDTYTKEGKTAPPLSPPRQPLSTEVDLLGTSDTSFDVNNIAEIRQQLQRFYAGTNKSSRKSWLNVV